MKYCIGDIHGCIKTLKELVRKIFASDTQPEFYFVGDLIDRGPDSKAVIDYILKLNRQGIIAKSVKGNHEQMLVEAYLNDFHLIDSNWQYNGAELTIKSLMQNPNLGLKVNQLIPRNYFDYINSLPYYIELDDYIIVHAGINFHNKEPFNDYNYMLWTRREIYYSTLARNKKIIHGHTPIPFNKLQSQNKNVINIDTGCVYTNIPDLGHLTALNLSTLETISIKNIDL